MEIGGRVSNGLNPPLDDGGLTLRLVAEWMGVSDWAASKMRRSARELYDTNAEYRHCIGQIRRALS